MKRKFMITDISGSMSRCIRALSETSAAAAAPETAEITRALADGVKMQSAQGAAAAVHGALNSGALAAAALSERGLLQALPELYRLAGELLPAVFHVPCADLSVLSAVQQTGCAILVHGCPRECEDLSPLAHSAALRGSVPFLSVCDAPASVSVKAAVWDEGELSELLDKTALAAFRARALNPNRPTMRGSHENGDIYFQNREAANTYYNGLYAEAEAALNEINARLATRYALYEPYGAPDAERVIITMGATSTAARKAVDALNARGERVSMVQVRLFRPFNAERLIAAVPKTARVIEILGAPLYTDVRAALAGSALSSIPVRAIGEIAAVPPETGTAARIWGFGEASRELAGELCRQSAAEETEFPQTLTLAPRGEREGLCASDIIISDAPSEALLPLRSADFAVCLSASVLPAEEKLLQGLSEGGALLLNSPESPELPEKLCRAAAEKSIRLLTVDAAKIARESGLGKKTHTVMLAAVSALLFGEKAATERMKRAVAAQHSERGEDILDMYLRAAEGGIAGIRESEIIPSRAPEIPRILPLRESAQSLPAWDADKCLQCNNCAFTCPSAALRPFMLSREECSSAPAGVKGARVKTGKGKGIYQYILAASPTGCTGCGVCAGQCPSHAIEMKPSGDIKERAEAFAYLAACAEKTELYEQTVRFSQYRAPLLRYPPACPGCAQGAYAKLVTQLFGERLIIANAAGCSLDWGGVTPSPYKLSERGRGPAILPATCGDAAEAALGLALGYNTRRERLRDEIKVLLPAACPALRQAGAAWSESFDKGEEGLAAAREFEKALLADSGSDLAKKVLPQRELLIKNSVWVLGGDGWAYDEGSGGLDHVLASGADVNILVFDNELCSSAGGLPTKSPEKSLYAQALTHRAYVAQISMGGDKGQTLKALAEAESFDGPSLIIAYCPCTLHGLKGGMTGSQREMDRAVKCGYRTLFRRDPRQSPPLKIDSKPPQMTVREFIQGEGRFKDLSEDAVAALEKSIAEQREMLLALQ